MSLEDKIKEQYRNRDEKTHLYNSSSSYVLFTEEERNLKIKEILRNNFNSKDFSQLTVLEVGAGHGNNHKVFVEAGIKLQNIEFNELLPERIAHLKHHFPSNFVYEGDISNINISKKYDVVFQSTVFSSVLDDSARKKIAQTMLALLNENGIILWYDFIFNNPNNKDVKKVSIDEIKTLFPQCEFSFQKVTLAPPIGRRVGKFYNLFNLPFLRSHILAVIKNK